MDMVAMDMMAMAMVAMDMVALDTTLHLPTTNMALISTTPIMGATMGGIMAMERGKPSPGMAMAATDMGATSILPTMAMSLARGRLNLPMASMVAMVDTEAMEAMED